MDLGIVELPNWIITAVLIIALLYIYYTWRFSELKALGIKHAPPIPVFGNMREVLSKGLGATDIEDQKRFGKIFGRYWGRDPSIIVTDLDIVKNIMVRDFNHFTDRNHLPMRGMLRESVFDTTEVQWKRLRNLITPNFSIGKLKQMEEGIRHCSKNLVTHLGKKCRSGEAFEAKEFASTFTMDTIAATVFGVELDSQQNHDHPFFVYSSELAASFGPGNFYLSLNFLLPFIGNFLDKFNLLSMIPAKLEKYFSKMINDIIKEKEQDTGSEPKADMIQSMMNAEELLKELQKSGEMKDQLHQDVLTTSDIKGMTRSELMAQSMLMFLAGFETTGSTFSFLMYNLAVHPQIQEKVVEEIKSVVGKAEPTYELASKLVYLEQCLNESIRLYPPAVMVDRCCVKEIRYGDLTIPKGMQVIMPIMAIHRNEEYWPNPEKYDPDRFSPENKASVRPMALLSFGEGPRNCPGRRLAALELKIATVMLLRTYKLVTCERTEIPPTLTKGFFTHGQNGLWLKLESREQ